MMIETIERTYVVDEPACLLLKNLRGRVEIQGGAEGQIQISAAVHTGSGSAEYTRVEIDQADDGSVTAITHYDHSGPFGFALLWPCRVDYTVRMPRQCRLEVSCVESGVQVEGLEGSLEIRAVNGDLSLRDLHGELVFSTVSGRISGQALSGPAQIKTVSGRVWLERSQFPRLWAKTVSGDLSIETPLSAGPYSFDTVSSSARLTVPAGTSCSLRFDSFSGSLRSELESAHQNAAHTNAAGVVRGKGRLHLNIGAGGPELSFHSVSGSLHLLVGASAASGAAWEEEAPIGEPVQEAAAEASRDLSPEDRHLILERVASGELSAEEGLAALSR
jgi:hypothetical protein